MVGWTAAWGTDEEGGRKVNGLRRSLFALALILALGSPVGEPGTPVVMAAGAQSAAGGEASATGESATSAALAGVWRGAIDLAGTPLEIVVRLNAAEGELRGTVDIPAQGAFEVPLTGIAVDGESIRFLIAGVPGDPTFDGTLRGSRIEGRFTQSGMTFPFGLEREATGHAGPAPEESADTFVDPLGRYSVPIPTGWSATGDENLAVLTDPDQGIRLAVAPVTGLGAEEAVIEAWARLDPGFDRVPYQVLELPTDEEIERSVVFNYDGGERVYQAAVVVHKGVSYVLLVDADLSALQRRAAQVQIVATGLKITGLEEDDLTDASLRPVREVEAELDAFIRRAMAAFGVPGAAVAVVQDGEVVYLKGFGVKEAGGDPITPDTHMMIGSVGKTLTTLLMAALVEEGRLDWEAPVVSVLPQFAVADPGLTETMAVRHLVCACSGVPRRDLELAFHYDSLTAEDIVESLRTFQFFTGFGEAFQYSNQLVATGGYVAAAADGAPYGKLYDGYAASLAARVLGPIGMADTTLSIDEVIARGDFATPHGLDLVTGDYFPLDVEVERLLTPVAPAGSHWSTARDMARYLLTQLNRGVAPDGTRVVSPESLEETWTPQVPLSATDSYGLGWMTGEYKGLRVIYHGGNTLGFTSELAFLPEAGVGIVVLTNAQQANVFTIAVRTRLFELLYGVEGEVEKGLEFMRTQTEAALAELQALMQGELDADAVAPYAGRFVNDALGEIELLLQDGRLILDVGEFRTELRPVVDRQGQPDGFLALGPQMPGLPVKLEKDDEGAPLVKVGAGAVLYTFLPVE